MTDFMTTLIDSPDGSFEVAPDLRMARRQRRWAIITAVLMLTIGGALVVSATVYAPGGLQILAIVLFIIILAFSAMAWFSTGPPTLKADSDEVIYLAPMRDQRMPRADLAAILRGEMWFQGRRSLWLKSYLFTARDGKFAIRINASWYGQDAMAAFAARLGVPLRGEFTDRYGNPGATRT